MPMLAVISCCQPDNLCVPQLVACALLFVAAAGVPAAHAAEHTLMPSPQTVHIGHFAANVKPVLTIESGDIVTIESAAAMEPAQLDESGVVPPERGPAIRARHLSRREGPRPRPAHPHRTGRGQRRDAGRRAAKCASSRSAWRSATATTASGRSPARCPRNSPRCGSASSRSTARPRPRRLRAASWCRSTGRSSAPWASRRRPRWAASRAARPASTPAISTTRTSAPARFSTCRFTRRARCSRPAMRTRRRATARVDLSAIETGLRGRFQFIVRKDMKLVWPRGETATHWIVMGLHPNLEEAMKIATRETIDFITKRFPHLTREEAYMIASVAVDYHVTQVVDGTKGIHGMIPKAIRAQPDHP